MKCLSDRLISGATGDLLWLTGLLGAVDAARLCYAISVQDRFSWHNKRVAIGELSAIEFASTLVFLDGLAQVILLLPNEDSSEARSERLRDEKIDVVVEGDGLGFTKLIAESSSLKMLGLVSVIDRHDYVTTTWLLPTSGTTGVPKLIPHTLQSLTRSISKKRLGAEFVWGSLYSIRRFAGLQVFLQSWICRAPFVLNEEDDLISLLSCLHINGCNALSATPSMWRKLAMIPAFDKLALKQITLGGEIVDQVVLDMLIQRFPTARVTHIYASTEAGVGFAVRDGKAGFPIDYLKSSLTPVEMRIDNENHLWLRPVDESEETKTKAPWIDSGDVVRVDGERVFFLGRANGSINVGGNKVMPEEVEAIIKELLEVAFVQVRARKSTMMGSLVEAAIVPATNVCFDSELKMKILRHCRSRLDSFKVPAFIVKADSIQLNASGKLLRSSV